jgi:hypothetical protein
MWTRTHGSTRAAPNAAAMPTTPLERLLWPLLGSSIPPNEHEPKEADEAQEQGDDDSEEQPS